MHLRCHKTCSITKQRKAESCVALALASLPDVGPKLKEAGAPLTGLNPYPALPAAPVPDAPDAPVPDAPDTPVPDAPDAPMPDELAPYPELVEPALL